MRSNTRSALSLFALLQTALWLALGSRFLASLGPETTLTWLYLAGSWLLWLATWGLLLAFGLRLFRGGRRMEIAALIIVAVMAAGVDTFLFLDAGAYLAFRIHGGALLIQLARAGSVDPAVVPWLPANIAKSYLVFLACEMGLAGLALTARRFRVSLGFPRWRSLALFAALFLADRLYATYTAHTGRHWLQGQTSAFPLYPNVSANRLIAKVAEKADAGAHRRAIESPATALTSYDEKAGAGAHPRAMEAPAPTLISYTEKTPAPPVPNSRPNIVFILEESWRRDTLRPEKMPILASLLPQFTVGEQHISGGNATRYGVFSFFYGLNPMLIDRLRAEKRGPYFFRRLLEEGYDIHIVPGQPLDILGTKETIFADVLDATREPGHKRSAMADAKAYRNARHIIETTPAAKPFFMFLFFSSTHARYDFLPGFGPHNYVKRADDTSLPMAPADRYENSLSYADFLTGNLIRSLMQRPDWDNTIVVVTGDHGEEFQEHGHNMHGWAFNEEETAVPLLARFPGQTTGSVLTHLTSHVDIVPTVLHAMGDTRNIASYSDGKLLSDTRSRLRYQQDWRAMSLFDGAERLTFYGSALEFWQPIEVTDDHGAARDIHGFLTKHRDEIVRLLRDNARFFN